MQLYALDLKGRPISARRALRQTDYQCLECSNMVRLRRGLHRQPHFYHLDTTSVCRQHQKGAMHLQLQSYFFNRLPPGDCQLEVPFSSIRRIADVAWFSEKIIFEIQCSPIKPQEVISRNRDYHSLGWHVVWILHDHRYNQVRLSAAEMALSAFPHFFSNMDASGKGMIYDQFAIYEAGVRKKRLGCLPVNLTHRPLRFFAPTGLEFIEKRSESRKLSFSGDFIHLYQNDPTHPYICAAIDLTKQFDSKGSVLQWRSIPRKLVEWGIVNPYRILFHHLLEKICR